MIEEGYNKNKAAGQIKFKVGDARFWKAIDDSFPEEEVKKVEEVGHSALNPRGFETQKSKIELPTDSRMRSMFTTSVCVSRI